MLLSRFAVPALFCIASAASGCNQAQPAQVAAAEQAYHLSERVESAAPPPAAAGGGEHASCGQEEGSCGASCGQEGSACGGGQEQARDNQDATAALTRVDPSQVCMVRNHFMGRPQLAVQAEGSTYYGCCPGCANRLFKDAQARQAIDPVSHNAIDKGLAVIGKTARGNVLYFENEANFEAFRAESTLTQ